MSHDATIWKGANDPGRAEFRRQVRVVLAHLNDFAFLQTHPFAGLLQSEEPRRGAELGKLLQQSLRAAIAGLAPDHSAPAGSHAWRTHQILELRYLEGLNVAEVQSRLALGKSEYYDDHRRALDAMASLLWEQWGMERQGSRALFGPDGPVQAVATSPPGLRAPPFLARGNLPVALTSFVGRERELAEVKRLLNTTRLLTLTGTGGVGKTRLALEVAREIQDDCADGVWLADLAPLTDSALVAAEIAGALGVAEPPRGTVVNTLLSVLAPKRLVLLIDNCEHLLEACARLAQTLLEGCPNLRILATSREALRIDGEVTWRVPSLTTPNLDRLPTSGADLLATVRASEAACLFLGRAVARRPDFALSDTNARAIAEIGHRLDGIPLAIELAAAQVTILSVDQIAARLEDRLGLLTHGQRTALPRHRTLRAAITWSWDLLSDDERALLRRLAVFAGGFTLEAVQSIGGGWEDEGRPTEGLDVLGSLVDKSLVLMEERDGAARYRLLETIREFARERLIASGEAEAIAGSHASYYLALAEAAAATWLLPDQGAWLARLEVDHDNLRRALGWYEESGDLGRAVRLAGALSHFWYVRGHRAEAWVRLPALVARREGVPWTAGLALAVGAAAEVADDPDEARALHEESVAISRAVGDARVLSWRLLYLGVHALGQGDLRAARRHAEECLAIAPEPLRAQGMICLAHAMRREGDYDVAEHWYDEALALSRAIGDPFLTGLVLAHIEPLVRTRGDFAQARAMCDESLALRRAAGDRTNSVWMLVGLGKLARLTGHYPRARAYQREALDGSRQGVDPQIVANALDELGLAAAAEGDLVTARAHLVESRALLRRGGCLWDISEVTADLGLVARAEGDLAEAQRLFEESLEFLRECGSRPGVAILQGHLGVVALQNGRCREAETLFRDSLTVRRGLGDKGGIATLLECFAGLASLNGDPRRAFRLLGAAAKIREAISNPAPPVWQSQRDPWLASARQALSEDAQVAVRAEGEAMPLERAVAYALEEEDLW